MKKNLLKKISAIVIILASAGYTAKAQSAVNFTGTPGNEATANYDLDITNGFTVEYNMYLNTIVNYNAGVTSTSGNVPQPLDTYVDQNGILNVLIGNPGSWGSANISNFVAGQWYNIAISYDPASSNAYVYVNGVLQNTIGGVPTPSVSGTIIIGDRADNATYANARFDHVLIWSGGARNAAQIAADQNTCFLGTETGLDVYYTMGEGAGTLLHNLGGAGTAANATLSGAFTWIDGYQVSHNNITATNRYYSPDGKSVWTKTGTYSDTINAKAGCHDSIVDVNLTITHRMYVNPNAILTPDGLSWATAYTDIGIGIDSSAAGDTIFVEQGSYTPASGLSYTMKDSVKIYGSFAGTESSLSQRNLQGGDTTKLEGNGASVIDNSPTTLTPAAVLDGFTITGGSGNITTGTGGGMYNVSSSPTLNNLNFYLNNAAGGGALENDNSSNPTLTNVIFSGNTSSAAGGAMENSSSSPTLTDVTFVNNSSSGNGGAIKNSITSSLTLTNVLFNGNSASGGGAIANNSSSATITNATFFNNSALFGVGGGFSNQAGATATITNSVFWGNTGGAIPDIYNGGGCTATVSYSYTQTAITGATDTVLSSVNPFVNSANPAGADGIYMTADDGLQIAPGDSAAGSGNVSAVPAGVLTDITGITARVQGGLIDMGAYESGCATVSNSKVSSCDSYTYTSSGKMYTVTASGKYGDTLSVLNLGGCDSIQYINLTINHSNTGDTIAKACNSFTWYGTPYTTSGSKTHTLATNKGCDSVVTLHLTIGHPTTGDTSAVACSQFTWYGNTYTTSGTPTQTLTDNEGCDSVLTLHLTIHTSSNLDTVARACAQFKWYGNTYTSSGSYSITTTTNYSCDSTYTLNLTISNSPTQSAINIGTYASTYKFKGITETASGHYTFDTVGVSGCDSTVNLYLTMYAIPAITTSSTCIPTNLVLSGTPLPFIVQWKKNGNTVVTDTAKWDTGAIVAQNGLDNNVYNIAVDNAGNVYVGDNTEVLEYPKGATAATMGVVVAENGIQGIDDVKLDIAGNIFVADYNLDQVLEFPAGSNSTTVPTVVASGFDDPGYLFVDNADNVYISDDRNDIVWYYPAGNTQGTIIAQNGLEDPAGIAVDNSGNLFVSDNDLDQVLEYPKGSTSSTDGSLVVSDGLVDVYGVASVALDGNGNIYVQATYSNSPDSSQIYIYPPGSTATTQPFDSIRLATTPNSYEFVMDTTGNIYVPSATLAYVKKFSNIIKMTDSAKLAGVYTAVVTSFSGSQTTTQTVTVNALPIISVVATPTNATVCAGSNVTLAGNGADSYSWSGGLTDNTAFVASGTETYTVTGTNTVTGCSNTATQVVTVNALPSVSVGATPASAIVCSGNYVTLAGSGAVSYTWSGGITDNTPFIPSSTLTYTLTGTDGNNCTNTATQVVTVNTTPTINVTPDAPGLCTNGTVNMNATGADAFTWTPATGLDVTTGSSVNANPSSTQIYNITGTTGNCSVTETATVTVSTTLTVSVTPSAPSICQGSSLTLNGDGASNFTWSSSAADITCTSCPSTIATPTATATYTVLGTSGTCSGTATVLVTVNNLPTITVMAIPANAAVCAGGTITLSGSGADSYSWSSGVTDGVAFAPPGTLTYTVTGTNTLTACSNTATQVVTVNTMPNITVVAIPANATVCSGNNVTLSGNGGNSYTWSGGVTNGVAFAPSGTLTYTVTGTNTTTTCSNTATKLVTVNSLPNVSVIATPTNATVCSGNDVTLSGSGTDSYTWSGGVTDGVAFVPAGTLTYTVTGTSSLTNCSNTAMQVVNVNASPNVQLSMGTPLTAECTGGPVVTLSGGTPAGGAYNGTDVNSGQFNPAITGTYPISYIYTAGNGCMDSAHQDIAVSICTGIAAVGSANGITIYPMPNNGHFTIYLNGNEYQSLIIYDETGKEVMKQIINQNSDHLQLDLSMYADGMYYVRLVSASGVVNKKIIVQK